MLTATRTCGHSEDGPRGQHGLLHHQAGVQQGVIGLQEAKEQDGAHQFEVKLQGTITTEPEGKQILVSIRSCIIEQHSWRPSFRCHMCLRSSKASLDLDQLQVHSITILFYYCRSEQASSYHKPCQWSTVQVHSHACHSWPHRRHTKLSSHHCVPSLGTTACRSVRSDGNSST